jgi:hypothetical protein
MELLQDQELDGLSNLEERIHRAVELVARLRADLDSAMAARDAAEGRAAALTKEVEALRSERQHVRGRVEKLLAQIDSLGAA